MHSKAEYSENLAHVPYAYEPMAHVWFGVWLYSVPAWSALLETRRESVTVCLGTRD